MITFKQFLREWWGKDHYQLYTIYYNKQNPAQILKVSNDSEKNKAKILVNLKAQNPGMQISIITTTNENKSLSVFQDAMYYKAMCPWSIIGGEPIADSYIKVQWGSKQAYLKYLADENELQLKSTQKDKSSKKYKEKIDNLDHELQTHYDNYDRKEIGAINHYTSGSYQINKELHNTMLKGKADNYKEYIEDLKSAFTKHTTPKDIIVHTGVGRSPEMYFDTNHPPKTVLIDFPAFTSTTIMNKRESDFAKSDWKNSEHIYLIDKNLKFIRKATSNEINLIRKQNLSYDKMDIAFIDSSKSYGKEFFYCFPHVIHIKVPKGSHGGYVAKHSSYQSEKEFTFLPDAVIELNTTPEVDIKKRIVHWVATLVNDGAKFTNAWKGKV